MKILKVQVQKIRRVNHNQHPVNIGALLEEFPHHRTQFLLAPVIGGKRKRDCIDNGHYANCVGQSETVLDHHITPQRRMDFVTEQSDQVPLDPGIENDGNVNTGEKYAINSQLSTKGNGPAEPVRKS